MCNPVCGMVHIKEPLLLIEKSSPCGGSVFPLIKLENVCHMYIRLYRGAKEPSGISAHWCVGDIGSIVVDGRSCFLL